MKKKTARSLALLMAVAMTGTTFFGTGAPVAQAADEWIGDDQLEENSTSEPEADDVLPSENQYNYQKEELAAFCHFGPNTFNEIEWGENYGDKTPNEIFKHLKYNEWGGKYQYVFIIADTKILYYLIYLLCLNPNRIKSYFLMLFIK